MSTSPDGFAPVVGGFGGDGVVRGAAASAATRANFDVDLRSAPSGPPELVDRVREAAQAAGYADGWARGQRAAAVAAQAARDQFAAAAADFTATRESLLARALQAVAAAAANLDARVAPVLSDVEDEILRGAAELAEALLGRELSAACPGIDALRRAMALVPPTQPVTVRLSPADHEALVDRPEAEYAGIAGGREITLLADPRLRPGEATAEYGTTTVDARLSAAIARVKEVLAR